VLYYLVNESILWCEDVDEDDAMGIGFPAARTVVITPVRQGNGVSLQMGKLSDGMFKPSRMVVPDAAIVMISDCTDDTLTTKIRATLSGIIMPGKN
jgi:uncharacterized protein YegJ (DUF2314 family)